MPPECARGQSFDALVGYGLGARVFVFLVTVAPSLMG